MTSLRFLVNFFCHPFYLRYVKILFCLAYFLLRYVLSQNKGNPEGILKGCKNIPEHAFGNHEECGSWCGYQNDPENYRHKTLPHGQDLQGDDLKAELVQVM